MTNNERITLSAIKALTGELNVSNNTSGLCLRVVREIVQDALGIPYSEFYGRYLTHKAEGTPAAIPCARDVQLSLRKLGKGVKEPESGCLVCSWKLGYPYGHIGILVSDGFILENTGSNRPLLKRGFLGLSHVSSFDGIELEYFAI